MNGGVNEGDKRIKGDFQVSDHCIITVGLLVVQLTEIKNRRRRSRFEVAREKMTIFGMMSMSPLSFLKEGYSSGHVQ